MQLPGQRYTGGPPQRPRQHCSGKLPSARVRSELIEGSLHKPPDEEIDRESPPHEEARRAPARQFPRLADAAAARGCFFTAYFWCHTVGSSFSRESGLGIGSAARRRAARLLRSPAPTRPGAITRQRGHVAPKARAAAAPTPPTPSPSAMHWFASETASSAGACRCVDIGSSFIVNG